MIFYKSNYKCLKHIFICIYEYVIKLHMLAPILVQSLNLKFVSTK